MTVVIPDRYRRLTRTDFPPVAAACRNQRPVVVVAACRIGTGRLPRIDHIERQVATRTLGWRDRAGF